MFINSKPGKYTLKLWIMADSEILYCADAQLYAGKFSNQTDVGQGTRVVLQLKELVGEHLQLNEVPWDFAGESTPPLSRPQAIIKFMMPV